MGKNPLTLHGHTRAMAHKKKKIGAKGQFHWLMAKGSIIFLQKTLFSRNQPSRYIN